MTLSEFRTRGAAAQIRALLPSTTPADQSAMPAHASTNSSSSPTAAALNSPAKHPPSRASSRFPLPPPSCGLINLVLPHAPATFSIPLYSAELGKLRGEAAAGKIHPLSQGSTLQPARGCGRLRGVAWADQSGLSLISWRRPIGRNHRNRGL